MMNFYDTFYDEFLCTVFSSVSSNFSSKSLTQGQHDAPGEGLREYYIGLQTGRIGLDSTKKISPARGWSATTSVVQIEQIYPCPSFGKGLTSGRGGWVQLSGPDLGVDTTTSTILVRGDSAVR